MPTVLVSVPKQGKRRFQTIGVFVADKGIINVDVPPGLRSGDEFELTYEVDDKPQMQKCARVPLPANMQPGHSFRHRAPNGKTILVSCPPGVTEGCVLLVPWSDSSNDHFMVQAQIAPIEQPKPQQSMSQHGQRPNNRNSYLEHTTAGFSINDVELARALSLTTLNSQELSEDAALEQALRASLAEVTKEHQKYRNQVQETYFKNDLPLQTHMISASQQSAFDEDEALRLALEASVRDAEQMAVLYQQRVTSTYNSPPAKQPPVNKERTTMTTATAVSSSAPRPQPDDKDDDDIILFKGAQKSRSAEHWSVKPINASPLSVASTEGVAMEPYAFSKTFDKQVPSSATDVIEDGFQVQRRRRG